MANEYKLLSCILPLKAGVDQTGNLTTTAVDLPLFSGHNEFTANGLVMPVDGSVVGIVATRETGHASIVVSAKVNVNGTAGATAAFSVGVAAANLKVVARFDPNDYKLKEGDIIGIEIVSSDATGYAPNNVTVVALIQLGRSH